jgi:hypothetical protein
MEFIKPGINIDFVGKRRFNCKWNYDFQRNIQTNWI